MARAERPAPDPCSLGPAELEERLAMIRREIVPHVTRSEELERGLLLDFDATPGMRAKLEQLVELERRCCSGLRWELEEVGSATLRLGVTGTDPVRLRALLA